ncbi:MAG: ATP-grasp domain-containing protein [Bacilli bacterium]|jgi:D-aspartate ligase
MKFQEESFLPVLLGGDISNYSLARSFYEAYQIKSLIVGHHPIYPTIYTKIVTSFYDEDIENKEVFLNLMKKIDKIYPDKRKILLGNNDNYVRLIIETKNKLSKNFIVPFIDKLLFNKLIVKEDFYQMCEKYNLDYPKTFIFTCSKKANVSIKLPFSFPVFLKPSDTVIYSKYNFLGKKKGYFIENQEELEKTLKLFCKENYPDKLIIQEYIPGDDSKMRIVTCYVDQNSFVKGLSMGHILLEDHTPMLVGNYTAIMSDYNQELSQKVIQFLEEIKYLGICHFDIKYDKRDKKYKFLEMNIRQGRNNYYTTAAGLNLGECLVNDYIKMKKLKLIIAKKPCICSIIPKYVLYKYVNPELKSQLKKIIKEKGWVRPLLMKGDYNFLRLKQHIKADFKSISNYKKYYRKDDQY